MCVMSAIFDYGHEKWLPNPVYPHAPQMPTQAELEEFRKLLEAARAFDIAANQPDCELEAKKERLRNLLQDLAEECGFDIAFLD